MIVLFRLLELNLVCLGSAEGKSQLNKTFDSHNGTLKLATPEAKMVLLVAYLKTTSPATTLPPSNIH